MLRQKSNTEFEILDGAKDFMKKAIAIIGIIVICLLVWWFAQADWSDLWDGRGL